MGKLSILLRDSPHSRVNCGIEILKLSDPGFPDGGFPCLVFGVPSDADNASPIPFVVPSIECVLQVRRWPKVSPSIVAIVCIAVINVKCRPCSGHDQIGEAAREILVAVYADNHSMASNLAAGDLPGETGICRLANILPPPPPEHARFRVVIQDRPHILGREVVAWFALGCRVVVSHLAALQWLRGWLGAVECSSTRPSRSIYPRFAAV